MGWHEECNNVRERNVCGLGKGKGKGIEAA